MNIIQAIEDPNLFGALPAFRDLSTWKPWMTFLKAFYGIPLNEVELVIFRKHTARTAPRTGGYAEAAAIVGRQSGKTQISGVVGAFEAVNAATTSKRGVYIPLIAQDFRGAQRALLGYAKEAIQASDLLSGEVTREASDVLELRNGVTLAVYPCRPASLRGIRAPLVVADELAFMKSTEGNAVDQEMLRAVRPTLATTNGRLLILSSPYGQTGALWDLHRQHYGRDEATTLVWQATAPEMNPTLPTDYLERMRNDDPEAYRSEVLGEFRAGQTTLFSPDALEAATASGLLEVPPAKGITYRAFVDPSGGSRDAFTLAVGHRTDTGVVVDALRAWAPPFNPSGVVAEAATFLKTYKIRNVTGDRYAGEWPREAFRQHEIPYLLAEKPKTELYLELLASVNGKKVQLLDIPELQRELRSLERHRGSSGKDRVDHPSSGHDDRANAIAGVVSILPRKLPDPDPEPEKLTLFQLRARQYEDSLKKYLNVEEDPSHAKTRRAYLNGRTN